MLFTQRTSRSTTTKRPTVIVAAISTAAVLSLGLGLTLPVAHAAETATAPAGVVLAADTTPAPAPAQVAPVARVIGIDANVVSGLSITAPKGAQVTLSAKGEKNRSKKIAATTKPAVFTTLTAGKTYTVSIDGKRVGTGTPVSAPGAAYNLTVTSTGQPTSALITWKYQSPTDAGVIEYEVRATPVTGQLPTARSADLTRSMIAKTTEAVMMDLDPDLLYTFTVTPRNTAATGTASRATLPITLGAAAGQLSAAEQVQAAKDAAAARVAAEKAAANQRPAPAAPSGPTTKTIYVCATGYTDSGNLCTKTTPFTYTAVTTTTPYTYHQEFVKTGAHQEYSGSPNGGTYYAANAWAPGSAEGYYKMVDEGYNTTVKDGPPTGFTDNGTSYSKTDQVKDTAPAGYTDNGTTWISTVAKEAKVVPA